MDLPAYSKKATELIRERYSCRSFEGESLRPESLEALLGFAASLGPGPKGGKPRIGLIAAKTGDAAELKGLGTYGFIKDPSAYLAAVKGGDLDIVDLGWAVELVVLKATELGIGSCWLGGTFNRGSFAKAAKLARGESLAIVIALGREKPDAREGTLRRKVGGAARKPWAELFFDGGFDRPIADHDGLAALGLDPAWSKALESLRLSPSASNKQPWALARGAGGWELFLRRTPGYRSPLGRLAGIADMQLNDMGIAMSHLALAAREKGLPGAWRVAAPSVAVPDADSSYMATFA